MKINIILLWIVVIVLGAWLVVSNLTSETPSFGGVSVGNEYTATTTPIGGSWTDGTIKQGWGSLGSVVITTAGDVEFILYDATSTAAVTSSSTQQLAQITADLVAGTYTYDVIFTKGLVMDVLSGTGGTSTITFR